MPSNSNENLITSYYNDETDRMVFLRNGRELSSEEILQSLENSRRRQPGEAAFTTQEPEEAERQRSIRRALLRESQSIERPSAPPMTSVARAVLNTTTTNDAEERFITRMAELFAWERDTRPNLSLMHQAHHHAWELSGAEELPRTQQQLAATNAPGLGHDDMQTDPPPLVRENGQLGGQTNLRGIWQPHHAIHSNALHDSQEQSWQNIFEQLQNDAMNVSEFYGINAGPDRHYEATGGDAAHTNDAREISHAAKEQLHAYLPNDKEKLVNTIKQLIIEVNAITDETLRRKVKFAVDRLLRDNENDMTSNFGGRQLLISFYAYLNHLDNGPTLAEMNEFWHGLSAYIDSGDYPDAQMGDVSTQANFRIGVFANDDEVQSDAGLHPACYGRLRNISSSFLLLHQAVQENRRLTEITQKTPDLKEFGHHQMTFNSKALSLLKLISDKISQMEKTQAQELLNDLDISMYEGYANQGLINWLSQYNYRPSDINIYLDMIAAYPETLAKRDSYIDTPSHQDFFAKIDQGMALLEVIRATINATPENSQNLSQK